MGSMNNRKLRWRQMTGDIIEHGRVWGKQVFLLFFCYNEVSLGRNNDGESEWHLDKEANPQCVFIPLIGQTNFNRG